MILAKDITTSSQLFVSLGQNIKREKCLKDSQHEISLQKRQGRAPSNHTLNTIANKVAQTNVFRVLLSIVLCLHVYDMDKEVPK